MRVMKVNNKGIIVYINSISISCCNYNLCIKQQLIPFVYALFYLFA